MPQFAEQGTWKTQGIWLYDQVGNGGTSRRRTWRRPGWQPPSSKPGRSVDASAPQLLSLTVTPDSVDTSESSRTITLTAHITDDFTGNAGPGASGGFRTQMNFISPSGQAVYTMLDGTKRVSGSPQDGWYEATITVPQFAEQGIWKTQGISLYDQVGNRRYLTAADMEAAGLATSFKNG